MRAVGKKAKVADKIDCTFGDSFCDIEVLDGVCEIEAKYTYTDKLRSSKDALQNQPLTSLTHTTRLADHAQPHSDRVRGQKCYPVSKELAENKNDGRQMDCITSMPLGTDTLEAIDAMDLDNSVFPDEITSPGDEIQRDERQGFSFLRKSCMNNRKVNGRRVCRDSTSETVRRSQRLRVRTTESTSELKGLPSAKECSIKEMSTDNKICDVRFVDLLCKGKNNEKDLNEGQVLTEINTNSLSEISVSVNNSTLPKLNQRQKRIDTEKNESECNKNIENSSVLYCKKIYDTKNKKGIREIITDIQNSPIVTSELQIEQESNIKSTVFCKKYKYEPVRSEEIQGSLLAAGQIRKSNVDHHSENYSLENEKQVEQELRNNHEAHPSMENKILSHVLKKTERKELPGVKIPGEENSENPKTYLLPGLPRISVELALVDSNALIEAQSHVKSNVPDKSKVQINSVGNSLSKENEMLLKNQLVCDKAQVPVKTDLCNKKSHNQSTNKDDISPVNFAQSGSESPSHQKDSESPEIQKTELSLRSPIGVSDETRSLLSTQEKMELSSWGLPDAVHKCYLKNGIKTMFSWQAECLSLPKVLDGRNLVYSAPTSAGKTLVAELLLLKRVMESKRKGIFILPFVSVAREKMYYLQKMFGVAGIRVEGFMGSQGPPGGLKTTDIAICTIEKANNIVNRLLENKLMNELGIIVVDELHMLGDSHRGYLLELLLTKIMFASNQSKNKKEENDIQIVGMSATLPNLELLANWLNSELYCTNFRPIPLTERVKIGKSVYDSTMKKFRDLDPQLTVKDDSDHLIQLCLETVLDGHSVLVFCPTKVWCEKLAESVAREFFNIGKADSKYPEELNRQLRGSLNPEGIGRVMEALRKCPVGLDKVLARSISFGAAFHHAGLTFDERDIIEGGFRNGSIRVLIATSTLSSGVNLPARRVIIRSPVFGGTILDTLVYKQMIGRAGRKGVDTEGESILICREGEKHKGQTLMKSALPAITSCLQHDTSLTSSMKRAILEVIVSGVATTPEEVNGYCRCTLLAASLHSAGGSQPDSQNALITCISFLEENEFIRLQETEDGTRYVGTQLGCAVLASGLSPDEGLHVFSELHRARQCFVLENELHIIYQVTPTYLSSSWPDTDWLTFLNIWESLSEDMKRVAQLVGVEESFIMRAMKGTINKKIRRQAKQLAVHQRFFTALALHDLVQEIPLNSVASKFRASRGMLQSLQQSASTFAGMVTVFCNRLGWHSLELLIAQFQDRLHFGIQRELCDLVRLSYLNGQYARYLYNAGLETVSMVAHASPDSVENILCTAAPFHSNKMNEGETRPGTTIWLSSGNPLTEAQAAVLIVTEARQLVEKELGITSVDWTQKTKVITTPRQKPSRLSPGLNSAGRSFPGRKRRSSVSPNLILRSEAATGRRTVSSRIVEGGVDSALTPLNKAKGRKRLSPALGLRRKSKSPKNNNDVQTVMRKRLSSDCEHDQRDLESSMLKQPLNELNANPKDQPGGSSYSVHLYCNVISKNAGEEETTTNFLREDTEATQNNKAFVEKNANELDDRWQERSEIHTERNLEENSTRKRERKDTKGKAKNRTRIFKEDENTCKTDQQKQVTLTSDKGFSEGSSRDANNLSQMRMENNSDQNSEKRERKDSKSKVKNRSSVLGTESKSNQQELSHSVIVQNMKNIGTEKLPTKSAGNDVNGSPKNKLAAGLLFGKRKVTKNAVVTLNKDKDENSFCIPESQEDKSDNIFSPKEKRKMKRKSVNQRTDKSHSIKTKNTKLRKVLLGSVKETSIPSLKIAQAQRNITEREKVILSCHNSGVSTSTPIGDGLKRIMPVSDVTPITDSEAKVVLAAMQNTLGDAQSNIVNLSLNNSENSNVSFDEGDFNRPRELSVKDDSDLFDEINVKGNAKESGKGSFPFLFDKTTEVEKIKDTKKSSHTMAGSANILGKNSDNNGCIVSLSESQNEIFLRTLDSQGFCLESFDSKGIVIDKEPGNPREERNTDLYDVQLNIKNIRKGQGLNLESNVKGDKTGSFARNFKLPVVESTINHNPSPDFKRKLLEKPYVLVHNKRRFPHNDAPSEIKESILRVPTKILNGRLDGETSLYQACSEEVDFGCDFSVSHDRIQADINIDDVGSELENCDSNGSYLCSSSVHKGLLKNVSEDASKNKLESSKRNSPLCINNKCNKGHKSDNELNQAVSKFKDSDDDAVDKMNETVSDSFFEQAFETYFHTPSTSEKSLHLNLSEPFEQKNKDGKQSEKNTTSHVESPEQNVSENPHNTHRKSEYNICDVSEKNYLGDTFSQLDITPRTEALLEGRPKIDSDMHIDDDVHHKDDQLNHFQTVKSRLSDDLFATPDPPTTWQSKRKQKEVKSSVSLKNMPKVSMQNRSVDCEDVNGTLKEDLNLAEKRCEQSVLEAAGGNTADRSNLESISMMTKSFCIIDVVNDSRLFEIFLKEWEEQKTYSLGLACEKAPSQRSKGGIGWRITGHNRTPRRSQQPQEVAGLVIENSDLLIVGIAVCWGACDAYYVNLRTVQEESFSNSLPTPPLRKAVPFEERVMSIQRAILKEQKMNTTLCAWDVKNCVRLLASAGLGFTECLTEDPRVASWMLNPGAKELNIYNLVMNHNMESLPLLDGIGSSWGLDSLGVNTKNPGSCRVRAATESIVVYHLMAALRGELQELGMLQSFVNIEMPSVVALAYMELTGMGFSNRECEVQKSVMQARMTSLERQAYSTVGHPFSLTSPDEISQVLYGELHLPSPAGSGNSVRGKRGRGGRCQARKMIGPTNKEALEKLSEAHPLPALILQWRKINSSLTKVVFPLQQARIYCSRLSMDRIHTLTHSFTATGRITMHEPNLQNIPKDFNIQVAADYTDDCNSMIRRQQRALANSRIMSQLAPLLTGECEEHTISLRHALVARSGSVLLAADYSQLELRLLAHLSSDEKLLNLLNSGEDVFKMIAAQIHYVNSEEVTQDQRQQAKQICYGMIYGIGARALGEQLNLHEEEALTFMDKFKGCFHGVQQFMQSTLENCRKEGYVLTLMGRRRYLPNITNQNAHARAQSERQAVNTAIQGSAADLVKLAMVRIGVALRQAFPEAPTFLTQATANKNNISGAFLVLQLHDELLYEVMSEDIIQVAQLVQSHMEGVQQLAVSLPVNIKVGPSWGSMQTLNL